MQFGLRRCKCRFSSLLVVLGLFIVGMIILTDGLRGLSGEALRRFLAESTQTPFRGAIAGAITTAAIQSSSATTVITIGFVSAGLLTFSQALGIIFGANIGTTLTGWLVAIVGFKLKLGTVILAAHPFGSHAETVWPWPPSELSAGPLLDSAC